MNHPEKTHSKNGLRLVLKIAGGVLLFLCVILIALFLYGYLHYGRIVKRFVIDNVQRESKGLYRADIGDLSLNLVAGNITIRDFMLVPDTALYRKRSKTDTISPILFKIRVHEFKVRGFGIMELARHRKVDLRSIAFVDPEITVFKMDSVTKKREENKREPLMAIPLPKGLTSIRIREIGLVNGRVDFHDCSGDSLRSYHIPVCNIRISHILVDSAHTGKHRLFNADDISVTLEKLALTTGNGLNRISLGEIGLSTAAQHLYVKNFRVEPLFNDQEYMKRMPYQCDRMDVRVALIKLERFNLRELILGGRVMAGHLLADSLVLDDFRDKRLPMRKGFKPPMPQDALRKLKLYLKIDTVQLTNGKATYREQVASEPGVIFFSRMNATLTGLTNDSVLLAGGLVTELNGTLYLQDKGKLDAHLRMYLGDPKNRFDFSAKLGEMDLQELNPMVSKLLPAKITGGRVIELDVPLVNANDDVATGHLVFRYKGLAIEVQDKKHTTWGAIKKGVINFVANDIVVSDDNPTASGKLRTGTIYFKRDKSLSIFNFFWKSAFTGLKSTIGFNSKQQKAMIKKEKEKQKK